MFGFENTASRQTAGTESRQTSLCSRELAHYIADMLKSLRTCAKAPDLRALEALLHAAEKEAGNIMNGNSSKN